MEWQTEKLDGFLDIRNNSGALIYCRAFKLLARDAVGPNAEKKILEAAGVVGGHRCVRRFTFCPIINARLTPHEHFVFRWKDLPDVKYRIALAPEGDSQSAFCPNSGDDFHFTLNTLEKASDKSLTLEEFHFPRQMIDALGKTATLNYLTMISCYHDGDDPIFPAIGRLKNLRGLDMEQWFGTERGNIIFDRTAVAELHKLEDFGVLALRNGIVYSDDALSELGTLKNLKALCLNLRCHKFANKRACVERLSFLKELARLEYLNISTQFNCLMPRDLPPTPNLKYLVLEGREYLVREGKVRRT